MARSSGRGVVWSAAAVLVAVLGITACADSTDPSASSTTPDSVVYTLVSIDGTALPTAGISAGVLRFEQDSAFSSLEATPPPPTNGYPVLLGYAVDWYLVQKSGDQVVLKSLYTPGMLPDTGTISRTELDLRAHEQPGSATTQLQRYVVQ